MAVKRKTKRMRGINPVITEIRKCVTITLKDKAIAAQC